MNIDISESRRDFLKKMFAVTVISATCPHIVLGNSEPNIIQKEDKILGLYHLKLQDYPMLYNEWGSVRFPVAPMDGGFPITVVVTRVPYGHPYFVHFTALNELCPHMGEKIFDLHPDDKVFICSGHFTVFDHAGRYLEGPAAQNLERFMPIYWEEGSDDVYIELYFYASVDSKYANENLSYLRQNHPNPASDYTTIIFGTEKPANVEIALFASDGKFVKQIFSGLVDNTENSVTFDVSDLSSGVYVAKLFVDGLAKHFRKIIVNR